jgi:hypothetical protein
MHRLAWAGATLILMALSFGAGRMALAARIMPEIVATLPGDESQFSSELDVRLRERFPLGTSQDKLSGYLVGANFASDWPQRDENEGERSRPYLDHASRRWLGEMAMAQKGLEAPPWDAVSSVRGRAGMTLSLVTARGRRERTAARLAQHGPASPITISAPILSRLVGESSMIATIGAGSRWRPAIAELGSRRVAERPAAHRLLQFDDRHPERHRNDHALELRLLEFMQRLGSDRECVRSMHDAGRVGTEARPGHAVR